MSKEKKFRDTSFVVEDGVPTFQQDFQNHLVELRPHPMPDSGTFVVLTWKKEQGEELTCLSASPEVPLQTAIAFYYDRLIEYCD